MTNAHDTVIKARYKKTTEPNNVNLNSCKHKQIQYISGDVE